MIAVLSLADATAGQDSPIRQHVNPATKAAVRVSMPVRAYAGAPGISDGRSREMSRRSAASSLIDRSGSPRPDGLNLHTG
jgi:hypothetical protein